MHNLYEMLDTIISWLYENRNGILVGVFVPIIIQLPFLIRNFIFNRFKKPHPKISVNELSNSSVTLNFSQFNKRKLKVDFLSFKIDIPGQFTESIIKNNLVEKVIIDKDILCEVDKINAAETIRIQIFNIQPEGWCDITINFIPTYSNRGNDIDQKPQFLDLHNLSKVRYNWTSLGKVKGNIFYYDFSPLKYMKEDNKRLLESQLYKSMDEIKKMNEKRKNW